MFDPRFKVLFLEPAAHFLDIVHAKVREKIYANIYKSRYATDPELLKKVRDDIWEFRTHYGGIQYRILAFWDNTTIAETLVIATHGFIKKTDKIPKKEINRAIALRRHYFQSKY
ncbi:MAG: type II toxin-antitoxin system RelE/ParE family toxin [Chitinophaga sp.]|uniref:type II toxin-antitoxin system RelE/ParE family toxin n=1 Tax=Chitinophaga sp. TaxID=1869181 RepID=UPI001B0EAD70|nr:type II toxin-antitoxin system RelE/ParE family toxin [Chitinophaga sp.]MBO9727037.1 type II toxin-antitoxin system RelE/ParE family toxin [Chitinophaga sp.]